MAEIINKFGTLQGWNHITCNIMGRDVEGITAISYSDSEEKENVYGAGKYPIGRGSGNYAAVASITLTKEEHDAIQAAIPPGASLSDIPPFDITVEYALPDGIVLRDRIRNCQFLGRGVDANQNDKSLSNESELICSHIEWNIV